MGWCAAISAARGGGGAYCGGYAQGYDAYGMVLPRHKTLACTVVSMPMLKGMMLTVVA